MRLGEGLEDGRAATNTYLVYFKNVVQAFEARFKQLGGKIVGHETYATGANNVSRPSAASTTTRQTST